MKFYQIAILRKPITAESRWAFVAHGARYTPAEAFAERDVQTNRGHSVRLLPLKVPA